MHYYSNIYTTTHYYTLLYTIIQVYYTQLYTSIHYYTLLYTTIQEMTSSLCAICREGFAPNESVVNANGVHWHQGCFVCVQVCGLYGG